MMKQVSEAGSRLENESIHAVVSTLSWNRAMTLAPLGAVAAMAQIRVKDPFPSEQKSKDPLRAWTLKGIMLELSIGSLMAKKR